jgi:hypothetical protein
LGGGHDFHRFSFQLLQDIKIDVFKFIEVKTGFPCLIFTQPGQQFFNTIKTRHDVEGQIMFARRITRQKPVILASLLVLYCFEQGIHTCTILLRIKCCH